LICTDIPSYNIYRYGELVEMANDIKSLWQNDFVAFIIGCSFSFEQAMMNEGIPMHYIEKNLTVSMYLSSVETSPTGIFCGGTIVSMRPMTARNAIRAVEITSQLPHTHGSPIHFGEPTVIAIKDISNLDWGDAQYIAGDETPVFWACGVTPQNAIRVAKPEISITHTPGSMLITDLPSQHGAQLSD
jgi:uncharacterized protein YcsI (UPF0317 family)